MSECRRCGETIYYLPRHKCKDSDARAAARQRALLDGMRAIQAMAASRSWMFDGQISADVDAACDAFAVAQSSLAAYLAAGGRLEETLLRDPPDPAKRREGE